ncbi:M50 family metallopeptidase [Antrihabitans cavernicola]|uniref:M50 family metallopeptidase n=1 Tax=Antrihabitans cavernicola TaxID=2495913 RepID=A0A5A7SBG6_9NOCA|nr:M50 family metallopeptidase [Spelaeibacter cavernicola]KAA0021923.1 M50 family metallopeptidase [Spelaeibacter cavernicola]
MNTYWHTWTAYIPVVVAAALVLIRPLWPLTRHTVTLAHEAGHAVAALATGRRLTGIRLHSDSSGLTLSRGRPRGPGMVLTAAAGYLAPSLLGLAGAVLIGAGQRRALLWGALVLMAAMLLFIRNVFGLAVLVVVGAAFGLVAYYGSASLQEHFGYLAIWVLLIGNVRTIVEGAQNRSGQTDVDQLRGLTHLPRVFWILLLIAISVAIGVLAWRVQYLG